MKKCLAILAVLILAGAAQLHAADGAEDVISLAQKGVGEDVLMAVVEHSASSFNLSTADIIKMKDNKVPDKVIAAMIKHKPGNNNGNAFPAQPKAATPTAPVVAAVGDGVLNIENLDDKTWSYMYEPDAQTIWISRGTANGRGNLEPHGGLSLRMPAGTYAIRYNGRNDGPSVTVSAEDKSLLMLTRVETAQLEALYVTVFEKGERKSGGRLVTLRENPAPKKGAISEEVQDNEAPVQRVVERERIVDGPSTVVYRDYGPTVVYSGYSYPYYGGYYGGYCAYPRYYSYPRYNGYCSPRYYGSYYGGNCGPRYGGSFGFGYHSGGYRSGFSVGIGGRF